MADISTIVILSTSDNVRIFKLPYNNSVQGAVSLEIIVIVKIIFYFFLFFSFESISKYSTFYVKTLPAYRWRNCIVNNIEILYNHTHTTLLNCKLVNNRQTWYSSCRKKFSGIREADSRYVLGFAHAAMRLQLIIYHRIDLLCRMYCRLLCKSFNPPWLFKLMRKILAFFVWIELKHTTQQIDLSL